MANTIEWGVLLQQKLDLQMIQGATSGWMEGNAGQIKYTGGKEVKVPKMALDGLGDYGRSTTGYPAGSVDVTYETLTMTQDRAREFNWDRHDVEESNFVLNASNVLAQFQRTKVIPEIDAYRYSKAATLAIDAGHTGVYAPSRDDILDELMDDIAAVQDRTGADTLRISMNRIVYSILAKSKELSRVLDATTFTQGGVKMQVKGLDGHAIVPVPSARMKTAYEFADGTSSGQEAGGIKPADNAKTINWIICPPTAPVAISKQDNVKIFNPDVNQGLDSWKLQYRRYHDLWILENVLEAFQVSTQS